MFARHEPMTLPKEKDEWDWRDAIDEVASSGDDVPYATMVSEITRGEMPILRAVFEVPSTKISEPL